MVSTRNFSQPMLAHEAAILPMGMVGSQAVWGNTSTRQDQSPAWLLPAGRCRSILGAHCWRLQTAHPLGADPALWVTPTPPVQGQLHWRLYPYRWGIFPPINQPALI